MDLLEGISEEDILVRNMIKSCTEARGMVINVYTSIDYVMDDIISKLTFKTEEDFISYAKLFNIDINRLNSDTKVSILKKCLENYDPKNNFNTKFIMDNISDITNKRNKFAHWVLDTGTEGIAIYKNKGLLRLMGGKKSAVKYETFAENKIKKLVRKIEDVHFWLSQVQESIS